MRIPDRRRRRRKRRYRFYAILFCPARPSTRTRPCYCTYAVGPEIVCSFSRVYYMQYYVLIVWFLKTYKPRKFSNFPIFEHPEITA
jgi:hypothetical protein